MVRGVSQVYYGALAVVSADNLGSLALGGFKESCTASRCSRVSSNSPDCQNEGM